MNDLDVARQAILNEEEGAAFYALAAEKAADPDVKEAFLYLKDEELTHAGWIRSLYERLVTDAASTNLEWDTLAEFEFKKQSEMQKKGTSPGIFTKADSTFDMAILEMSVFAAGILMEKESIEFYTRAAKETNHQDAKKLYQELVKWEEEHLNNLTRIHQGLRQLFLEKQEFYYSPKL
jgi:rubrerythrin